MALYQQELVKDYTSKDLIDITILLFGYALLSLKVNLMKK